MSKYHQTDIYEALDTVSENIQDSLTIKPQTPTLGTYSPNGVKQKYYRLSYKNGARVKHIHVCGGSVTNPLALYRAGKIRQLINRGADRDEIIALVKSFA
jgi:hypothetical protein